jgi:hypothetical protein
MSCQDSRLRQALQQRGVGYVLAVARNHRSQIDTHLKERVDVTEAWLSEQASRQVARTCRDTRLRAVRCKATLEGVTSSIEQHCGYLLMIGNSAMVKATLPRAQAVPHR